MHRKSFGVEKRFGYEKKGKKTKATPGPGFYCTTYYWHGKKIKINEKYN